MEITKVLPRDAALDRYIRTGTPAHAMSVIPNERAMNWQYTLNRLLVLSDTEYGMRIKVAKEQFDGIQPIIKSDIEEHEGRTPMATPERLSSYRYDVRGFVEIVFSVPLHGRKAGVPDRHEISKNNVLWRLAGLQDKIEKA